MFRVAHRIFAAIVALAALPGAALAQQGTDAQWAATLAKAKAQKLVLVNQEGKAFDTLIEEFTKKFGIAVDQTVARPTIILPRVKTEQANGQYVWDVWWATTSNMVSVAAPAGMLAKFDDYLISPELKNAATWRHPDYVYGDATRFVFTHSHEVSFSAYRNTAVLPELKLDSLDGLVDGRLKGKVVIRDASAPNAGSWALAPLYKAKGGPFLQKFLKDMDPKVMENPQQLDIAIMRGGSAIAFGMQGSSYSRCVRDSGCKTIQPMAQLAAASSRGLAVFKNAPSPEAAKVFVNWVLSKEGQEAFVREWGKYNETGAVSMRKDVEPHPEHKSDLPDFANAQRYVWVATDDGAKDIDAVVSIFKAAVGK
jgi:ABC-type Fe3+ transport system substrate-binding protein